MAAAFNAILADERPIKVRPWLYRIARNRCLNHLRRNQAMGVDSMDVHFSDNGASTADKVHEREEFRLLVGDIQDLPETQRTALVLREMDAMSYEQIAETMETTVPSVKSLLVRARVSLAEAAEARLLSCEEVRLELGEVAEGLRRRPGTLVRRHLRSCDRCSSFRVQLRDTNKALAALLPFGPLVVLKKLVFTHLGHSAGTGGAGAAGSGVAGSGAAAGSGTAAAGVAATGAGGAVSAGIGAVATKAVAGLAVTAIVTAGAVEVGSSGRHSTVRHNVAAAGSGGVGMPELVVPADPVQHLTRKPAALKPQNAASTASKSTKQDAKQTTTTNTKTDTTPKTAAPAGRTVVNNDTTNLASCGSAPTATTPSGTSTTTTSTTTTTPTTTCPPAPATGVLDSAGGGSSTPAGGTQPPADGTANPAASTGDKSSTGGSTGGSPPPGGGSPPTGDGSGSGTQTPGGASTGGTGSGDTGTTSGGAVSGAPLTRLK
jgi:RNA polymerase sigma factor (sigma-70 family)